MTTSNNADGGQPTSTGESELCMTCGLCCDGTIFDSVKLADEDLPIAADSRVTLIDRDGQPFATQPCVFLEDCVCTIYTSRYRTCRRFRCKLLRDHAAQNVDHATALQYIAEAKRLRSAVEASALATNVDEPFPTIRTRMAGWWRERVLPLDRDMAAIHIRLLALDKFLSKHFYERPGAAKIER